MSESGDLFLYPDSAEAAVLGQIVLGILAAVAIFIGIWAIVSYVFQSLSLYAMAKRRGISYPGLAWVPIGNYWIMGALSDQYVDTVELRKTNYKVLLLVLGAINSVLSGIVSTLSSANSLQSILSVMEGEMADAGTNVANMLALSGLSAAQGILSIIVLVFWYIALYRIYKSCMPSRAILYLVLSIIIPVALPFLLFSVRNKDEGMTPAYIAEANDGYAPEVLLGEEAPVEESKEEV